MLGINGQVSGVKPGEPILLIIFDRHVRAVGKFETVPDSTHH